MLGLRPRLRARNSLWDIVNKHPSNLYFTSQIYWTQPVEEGADGLPPLPISPTSPLFSRHNLEVHAQPLVEESSTVDMAPVSFSMILTFASFDLLIWPLATTEEERLEEIPRRSWGGAVW